MRHDRILFLVVLPDTPGTGKRNKPRGGCLVVKVRRAPHVSADKTQHAIASRMARSSAVP